MKKLLLFTFTLFSLGAFSQIVFDVQAPGSISGVKQATFSNTGDGNGWGLDLSQNSVTADVVVIDDGTPADSLGCSAATNGLALAGNIALIYRGDCEFGLKALNAENAGAIGVIIVNNIPGAPIVMGGGAQGVNVTIAAAMISNSDGADIKSEIDNGATVTVFMGSKFGIYNDDIGMGTGDINMPRSFSMPDFVANTNNFTLTPGAWVANFGNNNQTAVELTAEIELNGTVIYTQASTAAAINSGDTLYIALPDFNQATYDPGYYTLTYTVTAGVTDEDPSDNEVVTNFYVNDRYYSKSRFDSNGDPLRNAGYTTGNFANSFTACIVVNETAADSLPLYKVGFGATTDTSQVPSLAGQLVDIEVWEWNDNFATANDATFDQLLLLSSDSYIYQTDAQEDFVESYVNGGEGLQLSNGQKYLVCVKTFSEGIFVNYDNAINYLATANLNDEWYYPVNNGTDWFAGGFGTENVPAIYLVMGADAIASTEENVMEDKAVYPNPAVDFMNIPLKNAVDGSAQVQLMDMSGKVVFNENADVSSNELKINVTNIESGRYIINVVYSDGSAKQFNAVISK